MTTIHLGTEVTESQKVRSDLQKWKVIAVAALAAVGLGISTSQTKFELALCVIPFVMAYIDALCGHADLRIHAIARWHRTRKAAELESDREYRYMQAYERFAEQAGEQGAYRLQGWTRLWSSLCVNALLVAVAATPATRDALAFEYYVAVCGAVGLVVTLAISHYLARTRQALDRMEEEG